jgi:hypothetical protein
VLQGLREQQVLQDRKDRKDYKDYKDQMVLLGRKDQSV